ncbi:MAG TPA: hypothetical protein VGQ65_03985 [Thermoanaerobaculia bacterium]|jgi:hypothetical protein|nr:hypothetical protein [Thermoanaerobaculia bacterium]
MDDGTLVTVDNASGWSQFVVGNLVYAADRSTRDGCPYDRGVKGLFKTGDRVFVNQNYLAWFDYSIGDGVTYPAGFDNAWSRSGELAGFWTIDPTTQYPKYFRQAPGGCWNWPANELISGSASGNGGGPYWWDAHAPGLEHTVVVQSTGDPQKILILSSGYAQRTPNSGFTVLLDGYEDGAGVLHYMTQYKMASNQLAVDIQDGNDTPNSGQYILAQHEYYCRPNDILSAFKFQPTVNVVSTNINAGLWIAYAQDEDGTACDVLPGEQWPSSSQVTLPPRYVQSNGTLRDSGSDPCCTYYAPDEIAHLNDGPTCELNHQSHNLEVLVAGIPSGTWLRVGTSPTIDSSQPRWQLINLDVPNTGAGTLGDPIRVPLQAFGFGNETHDGQVGAGLGHGVDQLYTLNAGTWYQIYFQLQTKF